MFGEKCYKFCLPRMSPQNKKRNKTKPNTKKKKKGNFTIPKEREKKKLFESKTNIPLPLLWSTVFSSWKKLYSNNNFTLLVKG